MSRRRRIGGSGGGGGHDGGMMRWLLTYADLITLLMVFFVVMFAISNLDKKKYEALSASLRQAFQLQGSANNIIATQPGDMHLPVPQPYDARALEDIEFQQIIDKIKSASTMEEMNSIVFIIDERGLVISFLDSLFFDSGRANLKTNALSVLDRFGTAVKGTSKVIRVEGHTDDLPIATLQYPSNWELSAARAITVTRYLITKHSIDPRRLSATGYGEYRPKASNDSDMNRRKNRRVDIVVLRASVNAFETK